MEGRKVLNKAGIETIVLRMAYQVREQFSAFDNLVIIGIDGEGFTLAGMLKSKLDEFQGFQSQLIKLKLAKHQSSLPALNFEPLLPNLNGVPILIVDDVLNSGRTLTYCISPLVEHQVPCMKIAVLVERTYRKFPVSASITGISLSTTFEENVVAVLNSENENEIGVYLS